MTMVANKSDTIPGIPMFLINIFLHNAAIFKNSHCHLTEICDILSKSTLGMTKFFQYMIRNKK